MPIMAHERAPLSLRMVILAAAETVVDEQQHAVLESSGERTYQRGYGETDLAHILRRRGQNQGPVTQWARRCLAFRPAQLLPVPDDAALHDVAVMPGNNVRGQCIEDL